VRIQLAIAWKPKLLSLTPGSMMLGNEDVRYISAANRVRCFGELSHFTCPTILGCITCHLPLYILSILWPLIADRPLAFNSVSDSQQDYTVHAC
jgi:hypothetical protein